jgi:hypothetical protein
MEGDAGKVAERSGTDRPLRKMMSPPARRRLLPALSARQGGRSAEGLRPNRESAAQRRRAFERSSIRANSLARTIDMGARLGAPYRCNERSKG